MAFNSLDFILFLAVAFVVFWAIVRYEKVWILFLLFASYLFYTAWNGALVWLILFSSAIDYACGGAIARLPHRPGMQRLLLTLSLTVNLGLLGFYKYANFFIENISAGLGSFGIEANLVPLDIILPIGISFYTFQSLSYTLDIYLGALKPARTVKEFLLFVAFFPQLVAGPIVRAREFLPQLDEPRSLGREQLTFALYRLMRGLIKKMIIADYLSATIVAPVFQSPESAGAPQTFLALVGFHFQVYCDFSGYTDIAIGAAALFGFRLPENFNTPYAAHTPANYWRRWHMTLSRFCFDYIYRPLGGNRHGEARTYINTMITFSIIGFWHGANWNFVLFGVYHAVAVILSRVATQMLAAIRGIDRTELDEELSRRFLPVLITNLVIIGSLPLFRSPDMPTALEIYGRLLAFDNLSLTFSGLALTVLLVAIISHYVPDRWEMQLCRGLSQTPILIQAILLVILTTLVLHIGSMAQQSFVYFQF